MEDHLDNLRTGAIVLLVAAAGMWVPELIQPGTEDLLVAALCLGGAALCGALWLFGTYRARRRKAALAMLAEMRASGKEPDGACSYANALLTTLAKAEPTPVMLSLGKGVPALRPFSNDPDHLKWIDELPFRYEDLDGTEVVSLILTLAGYRFYHISRLDYELKAVLALGGGRTMPCRFHVRRTSRNPASPIVVSKAA